MTNAPTTSGREDDNARANEESGAPVLFPLEGDFSAVVPLSEVGNAPEAYRVAPAPVEAAESLVVRGAARDVQDESEVVTLVPVRAGRTAAARPRSGRPSWPVTIAALTLSVVAGLTAGIYLIKSGRPVQIEAPASPAEDVTSETADASKAPDSQPAQAASESRPDASGSPETDPVAEATTPVFKAESRGDKAGRDISVHERGSADDAPSGRGERTTGASHKEAASIVQSSERPSRKGPSVTADPPARREASTNRRAPVVGERPHVSRTPERTLPVSSPPASAKSKKVIQWP
jgi:hypothetical protein